MMAGLETRPTLQGKPAKTILLYSAYELNMGGKPIAICVYLEDVL